jgi:adenosylcobinamide-phosphate synthase
MIEVLLAVLLDFILGDPVNMPHPVRLMGRVISFEEEVSRRFAKSGKGLRLAGTILTLANIGLAVLVVYGIIRVFDGYPFVQGAVKVYLIYTCIVARNLSDEARKVMDSLGISLNKGRKSLSFIVGRDTESLSEEGVIRATVETVAENTSDGVIAPLLYIMVFGVAGGMVYKFVNTMDSMIGYKDEKYKDLGCFAARTDDLLNLIPSRLSAVLMILSAPRGTDRKASFGIVRRDGRNHKSPNSGYPESAAAGILKVQLGGSSRYKGVLVHKPTIGDPLKPLEKTHVEEAVGIMFRSEILFVLIFVVVKLAGMW